MIAPRATTWLRKARAPLAGRSASSARQHVDKQFGLQRSPSQRGQHGRSSGALPAKEHIARWRQGA
eukprot:15455156-Alexandrium_andersonii.AAC.1